MTRILVPAAVAATLLAACTPPPKPPHRQPPPRFELQNPNPAGDPDDPYSTGREGAGRSTDPYRQQPLPTRPGEYPVARPADIPNHVISPYPPHDIINVEDFSSGQLARDPSNRRIFRVP